MFADWSTDTRGAGLWWKSEWVSVSHHVFMHVPMMLVYSEWVSEWVREWVFVCPCACTCDAGLQWVSERVNGEWVSERVSLTVSLCMYPWCWVTVSEWESEWWESEWWESESYCVLVHVAPDARSHLAGEQDHQAGEELQRTTDKYHQTSSAQCFKPPLWTFTLPQWMIQWDKCEFPLLLLCFVLTYVF